MSFTLYISSSSSFALFGVNIFLSFYIYELNACKVREDYLKGKLGMEKLSWNGGWEILKNEKKNIRKMYKKKLL